jgi:predicted aldo/keto reductase-like oxidoreductase
MQYREDKYGNKLSVLGFGCMRFTQKGGRIDIEKAEKELIAAYKRGVNYYDTAYIYPGSEAVIGEIFERNGIRDKINIATKLPQYMVKSLSDLDKYFDEQLRRLRTDHVDYYLMHMLNDDKSWARLCALGIEDWINRQKETGRIRQIGFSYHGNSDVFCRLIDANDWDFCQVQYNYLDENSQAGRTGVQHAASKGIPVVIMEPLRGVKLVNKLPEKAKKQFEAYNADHDLTWSPAEWSFRWLWNQPEVTVVLSGMNSLRMVKENARSASSAKAGALGRQELDLLQDVIKTIRSTEKVGCTGCRYCMPCPRNVDIPGTFAAYNSRYSDGFFNAQKEYMMCTIMRKDHTSASNCIECGKCEQHCPQGIPIRQELKNARKVLEGPIYQVAKRVVPLVIKY